MTRRVILAQLVHKYKETMEGENGQKYLNNMKELMETVQKELLGNDCHPSARERSKSEKKKIIDRYDFLNPGVNHLHPDR